MLNDTDWKHQRNAVKALGLIGDPRASFFLEKALDNWRDGRWLLVEALGRIGTWSTSWRLIRLMDDDDIKVRLHAIIGLGNSQNKTVVNHLMPFLDNQHRDILVNTVIALGKLGSSRPVPKLLDILADKSREPEIHCHIIKALERIGDSMALPMLVETLRNQEEIPEVRRKAAGAIGQIGLESSVNILIGELDKNTGAVHHMILVALWDIATPKALAAVRGDP